MSIPINNQREWLFCSNEEIGSEPVPLKVEQQQDLTILKVGQLLEIELKKCNSTGDAIEAKYQIVDPFWTENNICGEIIFKADAQMKNVWSGFPTVLRGLCKWTVFPAS